MGGRNVATIYCCHCHRHVPLLAVICLLLITTKCHLVTPIGGGWLFFLLFMLLCVGAVCCGFIFHCLVDCLAVVVFLSDDDALLMVCCLTSCCCNIGQNLHFLSVQVSMNPLSAKIDLFGPKLASLKAILGGFDGMG